MLTLLADRHVIALDSSDGSGGGGGEGEEGEKLKDRRGGLAHNAAGRRFEPK